MQRCRIQHLFYSTPLYSTFFLLVCLCLFQFVQICKKLNAENPETGGYDLPLSSGSRLRRRRKRKRKRRCKQLLFRKPSAESSMSLLPSKRNEKISLDYYRFNL
mmetsp:Transcript_14/g.25  ORF Transcript_14/g.25 Transcript_14/m.25 type:complete len:104 (-) Transcript_14:606-917(-)